MTMKLNEFLKLCKDTDINIEVEGNKICGTEYSYVYPYLNYDVESFYTNGYDKITVELKKANETEKHYRYKDNGQIYTGQTFLNCGFLTDNFGRELIFE